MKHCTHCKELEERIARLEGKGREEAWPKYKDIYYYLDIDGTITCDTWLNYSSGKATRDFLGIFKTEEEAEARLAQIKEFIKNNPV